MRDHPRIRGEHTSLRNGVPPDDGSSPHTRGALGRRAGLGCRRRIIPAYAGSTSLGLRLRRRWRDHPRIRGEHGAAVVKFAWEGGSSPHTRGALPAIQAGAPDLGIIPAYAGSTIASGIWQ